MSGFPYIFTFYSYKGGVGRSMALLNTAYTLASWGRHVLIVDMDLEAPGLSGFLHRQNELAPAQGSHSLDILTLLGQIVTEVKESREPKDIAASLPPLDSYLRSVAAKNLELLAPKFGKVGRLDIVAADMERNWCGRLSALSLNELPQDQLIQVSSALHFYFKSHRFPHRPYGLEDFEPTEPTPYDYILIDSRTGITEVGGLCVGPVADRLVVLSALNDQNIEGTLTFLQESGIQAGPRNDKSIPWDDVDVPGQDEAPALGPKPTILVASPVPNGEIDFKKQRLDELKNKIGIHPVRLSYHPQMALMESVFVRDYQDEYLAREYLSLAGRLIRQVSDHPTQILARHQNENRGVANLEFIDASLKIASQEPDLGFALLAQISNGFAPKSDFEYLAARRIHATLAVSPEIRVNALSNWGNALSDQAKTKQGAEADRLWQESYAKYSEAVRIKPDKHAAFNNWGNALSDQAKTKQGAEADRLWQESYAKYSEAVRIKPDKHEAFNNWAAALSAQAKTKQGAEADRLWQESYAKYSEAVRIKPDKH
ncbi:hypothetical protein, partial [Prosthecobacter sp.]|uniref:KGGVGR-motif variant AAA ATPase n=1 Tax=Prosthecobacter sp. TaxID=1965333 RepID=UPI0024893B7E